MEWDSVAGIHEVQQIATSLNLNTNEIQTITTSVEDVNEVQIITSSAIHQGEVQAITVSPPPGENNLDSLYSFSLKLDTTAKGGSPQYSGEISATSDASGSRDSLQEILGSMVNIHPHPTVTMSAMNPDGGHTYSVTFPPSMGDVPELQVYLTDVPVSVTTVENANLLDGFFRLEYLGEVTGPIPVDANESEMQTALNELTTIYGVEVKRSEADEQNGFSWKIEFTSDNNGGNLDDLIIHTEDVETTSAAGGASVVIAAGGTDGSFIQGNFTIGFGKCIYASTKRNSCTN